MVMRKYIPSPTKWVAEQVELYESSEGTKGTMLRGLPVIIVTNQGRTTGATRKTPLMKVIDGDSYILVASRGGASKNPLWYYNLKANPDIAIRDEQNVHRMQAREVVDPSERQRVWGIAVKAFPPYQDYQSRTDRTIPIFVAEKIYS